MQEEFKVIRNYYVDWKAKGLSALNILSLVLACVSTAFVFIGTISMFTAVEDDTVKEVVMVSSLLVLIIQGLFLGLQIYLFTKVKELADNDVIMSYKLRKIVDTIDRKDYFTNERIEYTSPNRYQTLRILIYVLMGLTCVTVILNIVGAFTESGIGIAVSLVDSISSILTIVLLFFLKSFLDLKENEGIMLEGLADTINNMGDRKPISLYGLDDTLPKRISIVFLISLGIDIILLILSIVSSLSLNSGDSALIIASSVIALIINAAITYVGISYLSHQQMVGRTISSAALIANETNKEVHAYKEELRNKREQKNLEIISEEIPPKTSSE